MALLERVGTLLRANLNDLIDRAEDPQKMLKQLVLDMENQLLQVKTQVAIALADQHLLEKRKNEHEETAAGWQRKAELAVNKGDDELARAALARSLSYQQIAASFSQQLEDGRAETETLRQAFHHLQQKLKETQSRCDLLAVQHRRARAVGRAHQAHSTVDSQSKSVALDRMRSRILSAEADNSASRKLLESHSVEDRFAVMERDDQVETLLNELKSRKAKSA